MNPINVFVKMTTKDAQVFLPRQYGEPFAKERGEPRALGRQLALLATEWPTVDELNGLLESPPLSSLIQPYRGLGSASRPPYDDGCVDEARRGRPRELHR